MSNILSKKFNFKTLLKFAMPSIIMMIFMSLYSITDGVFISRLIGEDALSATNIVYPAINLVNAIAIMLGTGGSAIIAKQMGEKKEEEARRNFSAIVLLGVILGVILAIIGMIFLDDICYLLGANDALIGYAKEYLKLMLFFAPAPILQAMYQSFFVTAGKPNLGLFLTVFAGITNAVLDYILIVYADMGISGAALATATGCMIPAVFGSLYFFTKKNNLHFVMPKFSFPVILKAVTNGSSEMVTNLSVSVTTFLFNIIMMNLAGPEGVAAITIILYAEFMLIALYLGFSIGVSPVISYNYGAKNNAELKNVYNICIKFLIISSVTISLLSFIFAGNIVAVFTPAGSPIYDIAVHGFILFGINYLFAGLNIFASAFFTALGNGKVSALLSFMRTFLFLVGALLLLPSIIGIDGVWLAVPIAEALALILSITFMKSGTKEYQYI